MVNTTQRTLYMYEKNQNVTSLSQLKSTKALSMWMLMIEMIILQQILVQIHVLLHFHQEIIACENQSRSIAWGEKS